MKLSKRSALTLTALATTLAAGILFAQNPGLTRTLVGKADVSIPGREAVVARVEVAPGAKAGRHTHPALFTMLTTMALYRPNWWACMWWKRESRWPHPRHKLRGSGPR